MLINSLHAKLQFLSFFKLDVRIFINCPGLFSFEQLWIWRQEHHWRPAIIGGKSIIGGKITACGTGGTGHLRQEVSRQRRNVSKLPPVRCKGSNLEAAPIIQRLLQAWGCTLHTSLPPWVPDDRFANSTMSNLPNSVCLHNNPPPTK